MSVATVRSMGGATVAGSGGSGTQPAMAEWTTPVPGTHASAVQAFPSSTEGGAPATQAPAPLQVSSPLQTLPSEQEMPAGVGAWTMPRTGSHESAVQGLPSSATGGVPAMQAPEPSQASRPLQTFPSEHEIPAGRGVWTTPRIGSQESAVHGLPS